MSSGQAIPFSEDEGLHPVRRIFPECTGLRQSGRREKSVFVQHSGAVCDFSSSDSWVILSPIEQSIKRKIEAVGTPLKDWDIQINYGIKTGYNDAFIIDTEKREAILANCQTEEERKRTAELIRPYKHSYEGYMAYLLCLFFSIFYPNIKGSVHNIV